MYYTKEQIAEMETKGIGTCLDRFMGFTCTLRSDHGPEEHEALGPNGETANWAYEHSTILTYPGEDVTH